MHVVSIVGARPQFVKLGPVHKALSKRSITHTVVHSGQHYDSNMNDVFFRDLALPTPVANLGVGSASHIAQTSAIHARLESVLSELSPDWVLTYGDTNTTLAASLASRQLGIPSAHIEAGLRSFVRGMPEELNRVVSDHAADLLFAPTPAALHQLSAEGLGSRAIFAGDVMLDLILEKALPELSKPSEFDHLSEGEYLVCTLHRPANVDNEVRLGSVIKALSELSSPVILLAHPRLLAVGGGTLRELRSSKLTIHPPLPHLQTISLMRHAKGVVTDSGGLQKEAYFLSVPCTTLRTETEWPETMQGGWNVLARNLNDLTDAVERPRPKEPPDLAVFGGGTAATRIAEQLEGSDRRAIGEG